MNSAVAFTASVILLTSPELPFEHEPARRSRLEPPDSCTQPEVGAA